MSDDIYETTLKIAKLNDHLRKYLVGGRVLLMGALSSAAPEEQQSAIDAMRGFDAFTKDNDPYGEHDFGIFEVGGETYNWKIDYYDLAEEGASPDPTNPDVTVRVLTLFYASDY